MTIPINAPSNNLDMIASPRDGPVCEPTVIRARDVMTRNVVTVTPDTPVREIARVLSEHRIGAVPVLDGGTLVGIVTDGDLLYREEIGVKRASARSETEAGSRPHTARDVMTKDVVCVGEDTPLEEIARILGTRRIKRVPVLCEGRLVGIVSRADLVRTLAGRPADPHPPASCDDDVIRYKVIETLMGIPGASAWSTRVKVRDGIVELDGFIDDEAVREPSANAVRAVLDVVAVHDRRSILQPF